MLSGERAVARSLSLKKQILKPIIRPGWYERSGVAAALPLGLFESESTCSLDVEARVYSLTVTLKSLECSRNVAASENELPVF
jgi:hypothetical protein